MKNLLTTVKRWMNFLLSRIAAVLLSAMTLLVLYQVFTRYVLNSPAAFTEELVRYSLIWTGFIGAAYAFSTRQHMSLVLLRDSLSPGGRKVLMTFLDVLILLFAVFIITIGGFKLAMSAQKVYSALLGIPRSLVYAMAPISGLFIIVAQIINIYEDVTGTIIEGGNES
ncbi:TRAP transporter small permease [Lacrimispora sp.]|uniref:TRAP transporter small permease n=1 Tax=Lacrimispora sp. TaxID=2719234 RepID=UPI003460A1D3